MSLKGRLEIDRLFKNGRRLSGEYCNLVWEESDNFRYGIFIKGKAINAVGRNRVKRLYREAIRLNRKYLSRDFKLAFIPKMPVPPARFEQINAEINRIFLRLNSIS